MTGALCMTMATMVMAVMAVMVMVTLCDSDVHSIRCQAQAVFLLLRPSRAFNRSLDMEKLCSLGFGYGKVCKCRLKTAAPPREAGAAKATCKAFTTSKASLQCRFGMQVCKVRKVESPDGSNEDSTTLPMVPMVVPNGPPPSPAMMLRLLPDPSIDGIDGNGVDAVHDLDAWEMQEMHQSQLPSPTR